MSEKHYKVTLEIRWWGGDGRGELTIRLWDSDPESAIAHATASAVRLGCVFIRSAAVEEVADR